MPKFNNNRNGNQRNNQNFDRDGGQTTRSGIKPSVGKSRSVPYDISTEDVEAYLQRKANILAKKLNDEEQTPNKYQFHIKIYTADAGKKFLPFVMIIPETALMKYYAEIENEEDEEDEYGYGTIPYEDTTDNRLIVPFAKFISGYRYEKGDRKLFKSDSWRYTYGVSRKSKGTLLRMLDPLDVEVNHGKEKLVIVLLDPIRVFHDMLTDPNSNSEFLVDIVGWKRKKTGSYLFHLLRVLGKKKRAYDDRKVINELNARLEASR